MKSITRSLAVLFVLLGMSSQAISQEEEIIRPITKAGSAAMIFNLNGLGSFGLASDSIGTGGQIVPGAGFRYFIADDLALRILVGLSTSSSGPDSVRSSTTGFGLGVGVQHHFRPLYSTSPYVGAMVTFGSSSTNNGGNGAAEVSSSRTSIGLAALMGFDWFFTRGIAIGGEYQLGFQTTSGTSKAGTVETTLDGSTHIGLAGTGNVHVAVYF